MVDLLVIASNQDLQIVKKSLIGLGFHERDIWVDTDEKPYVGGSLIYKGREYDVNVHICHTGSTAHGERLGDVHWIIGLHQFYFLKSIKNARNVFRIVR